ncbi:MAG: hypothetical protein KKC71_01495 [Chloroflexi bacterium]|nr:hypothetical protein [Chloroflexota bacterium]
MSEIKIPRLRTVDKIKPPFPLNQFSPDFGYILGKEIVYLLATKSTADLAGPEWEQIFAKGIGATWKPSNVGLDDVTLGVCAWGAKTVKNPRPHQANIVRLISGRNSPAYSYEQMELNADPQEIGIDVLSIWNARVESIRSRFSHLRTVVLIKSYDLIELAVFEFETVLYPIDQYTWSRNERGNLEAFEKATGAHRFTWQPHGSQFTIIERVPQDCLLIKVKPPPKLDKEHILKTLNFDDSWITVTRRKDNG